MKAMIIIALLASAILLNLYIGQPSDSWDMDMQDEVYKELHIQ